MPSKKKNTKKGPSGKRNTKLPAKGQNLKPHEKIELARKACELYGTDQYTLQTCLSQVGIQSDSTWYRWVEEIEEIEELYKEAKEKKRQAYQANIVQRARTTLERYLDGFIVDLREQHSIPGKGDNTSLVTKVKVRQVYVKPSIRAAEIVLYNFDSENFSKEPEPEPNDSEKRPGKIEIEIIGDSKPITSEDDINDPTE